MIIGINAKDVPARW